MSVPMIATTDGFTAVVNGKSYSVKNTVPNFGTLKSYALSGDSENFVKAYEIGTAPRVVSKLEARSGGKVTFEGGTILYDGVEVTLPIVDKIKEIHKAGFPLEPVLKFLENLMSNPSRRAVMEAYNFLERHGLPLTEDGCFLAYKAVRSDYMDKYSGKISNKPGTVVKIARNSVDDDCNSHCSYGLHVGGLSYSGPGGWYHNSSDKVVVVKVNPRDVVSVPTDHSFTKMRVCEYTVMYDYKNNSPLTHNSVYNNDASNFVANDEVEVDDFDGIYVEVDDLVEGETVEFDYVSKSGEETHRLGTITDLSVNSQGYVTHVHLVHSDGEHRTYRAEGMDSIQYVE